MNELTPLVWSIGVDNAFGWLTGPSGLRELCEARLFWGDAILISLQSGDTIVAPADGSRWWQSLPAQTACAIVGIPAPAVDGAAELQRRLDPFHVERHRSARFRALVELIETRELLCGYALYPQRAVKPARGGRQDACDESPEMFAAAIAERVARGQAVDAAVRDELAGDARVAPDDQRAVDALLQRTGWRDALTQLGRRIEHHAKLIDAADRTMRRRGETDGNDQQLELL